MVIPIRISLKKLREMTNRQIDDVFRENNKIEMPEEIIKESKRETID